MSARTGGLGSCDHSSHDIPFHRISDSDLEDGPLTASYSMPDAPLRVVTDLPEHSPDRAGPRFTSVLRPAEHGLWV